MFLESALQQSEHTTAMYERNGRYVCVDGSVGSDFSITAGTDGMPSDLYLSAPSIADVALLLQEHGLASKRWLPIEEYGE